MSVENTNSSDPKSEALKKPGRKSTKKSIKKRGKG